MAAQMEPTEWFDQFESSKPEGWEAEQWCWRHWAPCPLLGANGILASIMVMSELFKRSQEDLSLDAVAGWLDEQAPHCCALGDEAMGDIWANCPPSCTGEPEEEAAR